MQSVKVHCSIRPSWSISMHFGGDCVAEVDDPKSCPKMFGACAVMVLDWAFKLSTVVVDGLTSEN